MNLKYLCGALLVMSAMLVSCDKEHPRKINANGREYVDLGLPSGLKWATCNLGASHPEDFGGYYQWGGLGDVADRSIYLAWDNSPDHTGSDENTGWTKYVHSAHSSYWSGPGSPDNKNVLDPDDDVAHVKWGGDWRMPTLKDWKELRDSDNCSWTWTTINDIYGYKVQSLKPGYTDNWIFLPAAGERYGSTLDSVLTYGFYWSSSLCSIESNSADGVMFHHSKVFSSICNRYTGQSIRPVID